MVRPQELCAVFVGRSNNYLCCAPVSGGTDSALFSIDRTLDPLVGAKSCGPYGYLGLEDGTVHLYRALAGHGVDVLQLHPFAAIPVTTSMSVVPASSGGFQVSWFANMAVCAARTESAPLAFVLKSSTNNPQSNIMAVINGSAGGTHSWGINVPGSMALSPTTMTGISPGSCPEPSVYSHLLPPRTTYGCVTNDWFYQLNLNMRGSPSVQQGLHTIYNPRGYGSTASYSHLMLIEDLDNDGKAFVFFRARPALGLILVFVGVGVNDLLTTAARLNMCLAYVIYRQQWPLTIFSGGSMQKLGQLNDTDTPMLG